MSYKGFDRRAFLKSAQMTALMGAVGAGSSLAAADSATTPDGKFDFDTPYNRIGTDSIKWDWPMKVEGINRIVAGMGVADMDFPCAPVITEGHSGPDQARSLGLSGYAQVLRRRRGRVE